MALSNYVTTNQTRDGVSNPLNVGNFNGLKRHILNYEDVIS